METKGADDAAPERARVGFDWRGLIQTVGTQVDWTTYAQVALDSDAMGAMVGAAVRILGHTLEHAPQPPKKQRKPGKRQARPEAPPIEPAHTPPPIDGHDAPAASQPLPAPAVVEAALVLGVSLDATEDQLRAALRAKLSSSRVHPDHGGDGEAAKRLIAARNLLIEHARSR